MNDNKGKAVKFLSKNRLFFILLCVIIIMSAINPRFFTVSNFSNIFKQIATNSVLAAGLCFVILTGGIDISVGSVLAFIGAVSVTLVSGGMNIILVIFISLLLGAVIGFMNGALVAYFNLQAMIVTLATSSIFRGLTYILTDGAPIPLKTSITGGAIYKWIGSGNVVGALSFPLVIVILIYIIAFFILNRTAYGRHVYALGGNEEAAKMSGINTTCAKTMAYVVCGIMSAIAGILISARVSSAQPTAGQSYEMDAIAAVVIGGTSLRGGEGRVLYTVIGAIIIGMLNNFLNLMGVDSYYQIVVKGVVILIAVLSDAKTVKSSTK